jgi:hypothetical protein
VYQAKSDDRMLWVQLSGVKWEAEPRKGVEVEKSILYSWVFGGPVALGGGLAFRSRGQGA